MQSDKKVGLALGVLLIGIVGAFFFRNETGAGDVPQLEDPKSLDKRIAEKPLTPYPAEKKTAPARKPKKPQLDVPDEKNTPFASNTPDPKPIPVKPKQEKPPAMFSSHKTPPAQGQMRLYRIQPGDTLSGLALRFLGRSSRYREIYEVNRDRLASPDDLRINLEIRIPPRNGQAAPVRNPSPRPQPQPRRTNTEIPPFEPIERDRNPYPSRNNDQGHSRPAPRNERQQRDYVEGPIADANPHRYASSGTETRPTTYRVQHGDNLETIARRFYGDRRYYLNIYKANRDILQSPGHVREGTIIRLP